MTSLRRGLVHSVGVVSLVGLLFLPLALSGHHHQANAPDVCALCVVSHYSPATTAPPVPQMAPPQIAAASALVTTASPARRSQPRPSGRAPPIFLSLHVA